ncbi:hypothetical protein AN219_08345, partial [Streptomyces nanshensis]
MNGAPWPLVGRDESIGTLCSLLLDGDGPGALLTGEPGIGKSRLADAVLERCAGAGMYTARISGAEASSSLPFGAASGLLTREPAADLFARAARELRRGAAGRRVVLGVDEAGHLDEVSAALVRHLAATGSARLLVTARTGAPESATVRALRRRLLVREITVGGLDREQVGELLRLTLGGPVDGVTADRLFRLTKGNPLFLRHVVAAGRGSGALRAGAGVWRWHGRPGGHEKLGDLVAAQLGALGDAPARALELVSHVEPVPLTVLERLTEPDELEELERRSLIVLETRGRRPVVRAGHPLYGEVVRARTSPAARRAVYSRFAAALGSSDLAGEERLPLVNWRLLAGERVPDGDVLAAASEALAGHDPQLAEDLARRVADADGRALLAEALVVQGKAEEAETVLSARDLRHLGALRALNLFWGLRRTADAAALVRAARTDGDSAPELAVAELALAVFGGGDAQFPESADAAAGTGVTEFTGTADAARTVDAAGTARFTDLPPGGAVAGAVAPLRAYLLTFTGRPAKVVAEAGTNEAPPTGVWPAMDGAARACHLHALVLDGRLLAALAIGRQYYEAALEKGAGEETALLSLELGVCETWAGRHDAALPHFREARALTDEHTPFPVQAYVCSELAAGLAARGEFDAAWRMLGDGAGRLPADSAMRAHLTLGRVRVLACSGRLEEAAAEAVALSGRYLAGGRLTNAAEALYYAARTRPSADTAARLEEVASSCDSALFPVLALHARAAAEGDPAALGQVSGTLAGLGYHGMAAEAAASAAVH